MDIQKAKHLYLELDKKNPDIQMSYIFEKHDGWFGYLDFPSCKIHSRKQREIPAVRDLSNEIREQRPQVKGRLIFEIMIEGYEVDRFHELNGILNRKDEQAEGAYILVHDFIPDWKPDAMTFQQRYEFAQEIVKRIDLPTVRMSPILAVSDHVGTWKDIAETVWQRGGEGIIAKQVKAKYSPGSRIASLLKIKEECTVEMKVLGIVEGTGEHVGMAGKLVCLDEVNQKHEIGMGSATHEERELWFMEPEHIVGQVVEIKAMKKLKDGSYREPRFKAIRYDKEVHELG